MLPRKNRIFAEKDFLKLKEEGKKLSGEFITLVFLKREKEGVLRFGIIVSNKISKKAVVRNALKRKLRASVREFVKDVYLGYDILLLPKRSCLLAEEGKIEKEVENLMQKLLK